MRRKGTAVRLVKVKVKSLSHVRLFVTPRTVAYQASPSMGFSRQDYWSGLPFPSPGDLPDPGMEPGLPHCRQMLLPSELKERSRQLAEAVARALAAGQASETHPERGTGFASAAMKWSDSFMRESMKKNPEWMRKHAQAPLMRSLCPEHRTHKGSRGQ